MSRADQRIPTDIQEVAADWIVRRDAGLTPVEEAEFERWRAADLRHAAALAQHDQTWSTLDRPLRVGQAKLLLEQLGTRASARRRRVGLAAAAVAVLLVAGLEWQMRRPRAGDPIAFAPSAATTVVVTPKKQFLPDGSVVELNVGATIAVHFEDAVRRVALRKGEALFRVAKDPARPFIVEADRVEVHAVGTAFNVQLGASHVEVLVTEGRVAVNATHGAEPAGPQRSVIVDAGNQSVVEIDPIGRATLLVEPMSPEQMNERLGWRAPHLEFSGTRLAEAVALMNRYAPGPQSKWLIIGDAAISNLRVSGFFRAGNAEAFVRLLQASFGIKVERSGNTIVLREAK
jgi:transmembrane sensor